MKRKEKPITLGVDLGGTKVEAALVDDKGHIIFSQRYPTHSKKGPAAVIADIQTCVKDCMMKASKDAVALGIGVAGQVEPSTGSVKFAPNLGWRDVPLGDELEKSIGLPVIVMNDVRAATYGEWLYGAGKGMSDLVCVFVGTGIGGGAVCGGQMLEGCSNTAGELGHITIVAGGRRCHCSNLGCLEAYAGGWAIAERAKEAVKDNIRAGQRLIHIAGTIDKVTASTISSAFKDKDPLANQLIEDTERYLSSGIVSIVNAFNPCLIILGGGIIENLPELVSLVEQRIREHALEAAVKNLKIVQAALGGHAAVIGAAAMAKNKIAGE